MTECKQDELGETIARANMRCAVSVVMSAQYRGYTSQHSSIVSDKQPWKSSSYYQQFAEQDRYVKLFCLCQMGYLRSTGPVQLKTPNTK